MVNFANGFCIPALPLLYNNRIWRHVHTLPIIIITVGIFIGISNMCVSNSISVLIVHILAIIIISAVAIIILIIRVSISSNNITVLIVLIFDVISIVITAALIIFIRIRIPKCDSSLATITFKIHVQIIQPRSSGGSCYCSQNKFRFTETKISIKKT